MLCIKCYINHIKPLDYEKYCINTGFELCFYAKLHIKYKTDKVIHKKPGNTGFFGATDRI